MYFRDKSTRSGGNVVLLVESYRNEAGVPRQRVVISLGDAAIAHGERDLIAHAVERRLYAGEELIDVAQPDGVKLWTEFIVRRVGAQGRWNPMGSRTRAVIEGLIDGVHVSRVTHEETALLGGVLVGLEAWRRLDMDRCLQTLGFNASQRIAAAVNVINRLVDPVSENALPDWAVSTALPELLGDDALKSARDRFYRVADRLVVKRRQIETHLRVRQREVFGIERTMILYDLTNTYFEGTALGNPKAHRGISKEKRDDCPQVAVGMVFDEHGFELTHEVFKGGTSDSKTLGQMLALLKSNAGGQEDLLDGLQPLVIIDGGIATKANRALLRKEGYSYLVNETRTARGKWREEFLLDEAFETVAGREGKSPVRVRLIERTIEGRTEQVLLCKSQGRREKELAIRSGAEKRLIEKLQALEKRIDSGRLKDAELAGRAIGRIQSKCSRVSRFYEVTLEREPKLRLIWRSLQRLEHDDELLGCYVLLAEGQRFESQQMWSIYMTLSKAEDGFRCLKSSLGLRPVRHHKELRCDAHIFICVIAYHLLRHILYQLELMGDHRNWETIRRVLQSHVYTTVVMPTAIDGTYRIRSAGQPDALQKEVYSRLGIDCAKLPVRRQHIPNQN